MEGNPENTKNEADGCGIGGRRIRDGKTGHGEKYAFIEREIADPA